MILDWQNIAAVALVAVALIHLAWRIRRAGKSRKAAGYMGCTACGPRARQNRLISIELPKKDYATCAPDK